MLNSDDSSKKLNKIYKKLLSEDQGPEDLHKVFTKKDDIFTKEPDDGIYTLFNLMDRYANNHKNVFECLSVLYKLSIEPQTNHIISNTIIAKRNNEAKILVNALNSPDNTRICTMVFIKLLEDPANKALLDTFLNANITEAIFSVMRKNNQSREVQKSCYRLLYLLSSSKYFPEKVSPEDIALMLFLLNIFKKNTDILFNFVGITSALVHTETKQEIGGKICAAIVSGIEASKDTERSQEFVQLAFKFFKEAPKPTKEGFVVERKSFNVLLQFLKFLDKVSKNDCLLIFDALKGCGEANASCHSDILGPKTEDIIIIIVRLMMAFPDDYTIQEKGLEALSFYFGNFETCKSALQPPNRYFEFVVKTLMDKGPRSYNIQKYGCNVLVQLSRIGECTAKLISESLNPESLLDRFGTIPIDTETDFYNNAYIILSNFFKFHPGDFKKTKAAAMALVEADIEGCLQRKALNAETLFNAINLFIETVQDDPQVDVTGKVSDVVLDVMSATVYDNKVQGAGCKFFAILFNRFNGVPTFVYTPNNFALQISNAIMSCPKDATICINGCKVIFAEWNMNVLSDELIKICTKAMCLVMTNFYKDQEALELSSKFVACTLTPGVSDPEIYELLAKNIVDVFNGISSPNTTVDTIKSLILLLQNTVATPAFSEMPERLACVSDTLLNMLLMFKEDSATLPSLYYILFTIGKGSNAGASSLQALANSGEDRIGVVLASLKTPGEHLESITFAYGLLINSFIVCQGTQTLTEDAAVTVLENTKIFDVWMSPLKDFYTVLSSIFIKFQNTPKVTSFYTNPEFIRTIFELTQKSATLEAVRFTNKVFANSFQSKEHILDFVQYVPGIIHLMESYPSDEPVQVSGLNALRDAARFYKENDVVKAIFDSNKVSDFVSGQMGINRGNNTVIRVCREILAYAPTSGGLSLLPGSSISISSVIDLTRHDMTKGSALEVLMRTVPRDFYETIKESLKAECFQNVRSMLKYSQETADYLEENNLLCGLTISDAIAVTVYTYDNGPKQREMNVYRVINRVLSERNTALIFQTRGYIIRLLSALRKLPPFPTDTTLYRGIRGKVSKGTITVGSILAWPAFTSTTTDRASVMDFVNPDEDELDEEQRTSAGEESSYIFEITGHFRGYNIKNFSFHPGEDEVLLEPETTFEVTAVEPDPSIPGVTHISVRVLDSEPILKTATDNFARMVDKMESRYTPSLFSTKGQDCKEEGEGGGPAEQSQQDWDAGYLQAKPLDPFYCINPSSVRFPEVPKGYYQTLKDVLEPMFGGKVFEMIRAFKTKIIDDAHSEGAELMKVSNLDVEEAAAISVYTYNDNGSITPREVLNNELLEMNRGIGNENMSAGMMLGYMLHLVKGLYKLPLYNETDRVYVLASKNEFPACSEGSTFALPTFSTAYPNENSARKARPFNENVVILELVDYTYCYNIAPLSLEESLQSVLLVPGIHMRVTGIFQVSESVTKVSARALASWGASADGAMNCAWPGWASEVVRQFVQNRPLPKGWISTAQIRNFKGSFYHNVETGESQTEKPPLVDINFFSDTFEPGFAVATEETMSKLWKLEFDCVTKKPYYRNSLTNEKKSQMPEFMEFV